jgi:hypothetical protein
MRILGCDADLRSEREVFVLYYIFKLLISRIAQITLRKDRSSSHQEYFSDATRVRFLSISTVISEATHSHYLTILNQVKYQCLKAN